MPAPEAAPSPVSSRTIPAAVVAVSLLLFSSGGARATEGFAFFEEKVRPLLAERCLDCHSEESGKRKGGLWLDRKAGWETGGDSGAALVPGDPERSLLIESVRYHDEALQMPPKRRLSEEETGILERWVALGAPDPRDAALAGAVRQEAIDYEAERKGWAYRPLLAPDVPEVADTAWPRNDSDRFLLAALEEKGFAPAPDAGPATLLRRVHFDLTGLPPTRKELGAFLADPSGEAFAAVVDDLLDRPGYGEKWGRHWLDVARYADSNGGDRNFTYYQAWRYRNYVIDAFQRDKPYYDFVREQIAGDLLPAEDDRQRHDQLVASTFLALGPKMLTERDKEKLRLDTADEQLDTVGRAFLGLTLGCARCHDHKFDPLSQEDYYALAGIFRSTEVVHGTRNGCVNVASWIESPLPLPGEEGEALGEKVERLELAMRLTVEKQFQNKVGGKGSGGKLPFAGLILDENEAELTGDWTESSHSPRRYGGTYAHDNQEERGRKRAVFRGTLPESGLYEVRLSYCYHDNRSSRVPVTVEARDGTHREVLDQREKPEVGGLFQPIGRFEFEKGARAEVILETTGADGYVIVDAVQFVAVEDIAREKEALAAAGGDDVDSLFHMSEGELKKELKRLIDELKDAEVAMAPRDSAGSADIALRIRGETHQPGAIVPRGFPRVLHRGPAPEIPEGSSGRRQLADWLVSEENALLDRVIVNRVWHHLFGRGLVATVDNFGKLGSGPSNPELLDRLASGFRASGGSLKSLIRELVLSRAYRLSASAPVGLVEADPENALFGRRERRRLAAEEIRDGILFLSGRLDREPAGPTATPHGVDLDKPITFTEERKRTVYLPVPRNNLVAEMAAFDAANPDLVTGARARTTVPVQALYLLNNEFITERAADLGAEACASSSVPGEQIAWLYRTLLHRSPGPGETQRALGLVADLSGGAEDPEPIAAATGHLAHMLMASAEFLYLE